MKHTLEKNTYCDLPRPLPYHSRTEHILPPDLNVLQHEVFKLQKFAEDHHMKYNQKKTKVAIFNPLRSYDVMPEIKLTPDSENIEVVEEYKLLGQVIRTDMRTISNTENICNKAYVRMWILRRLKELSCSNSDLLDVMRHQIISITEQAVPHCGPMITKRESNLIERVLKTALHIIFQSDYTSFCSALK